MHRNLGVTDGEGVLSRSGVSVEGDQVRLTERM